MLDRMELIRLVRTGVYRDRGVCAVAVEIDCDASGATGIVNNVVAVRHPLIVVFVAAPDRVAPASSVEVVITLATDQDILLLRLIVHEGLDGRKRIRGFVRRSVGDTLVIGVNLSRFMDRSHAIAIDHIVAVTALELVAEQVADEKVSRSGALGILDIGAESDRDIEGAGCRDCRGRTGCDLDVRLRPHR